MDINLCLKVVVLTAVSTTGLKMVLSRDHTPKVALIAFALSLLYAINDQHYSQVDYFIWLATTGLFSYVLILCAVAKIGELIIRLIQKEPQSKIFLIKSKSVIGVTIAMTLFMAFHCLSHPFFFSKLTSTVFLSGVGLVLLSLFLLAFVDRLVVLYFDSQTLRRKLFHVGPILMVPLLHYSDAELLVLILTVGLFLFFMLEMTRYALSQLKKYQLNSKENNKLNKLMKALYDLIGWMQSFNQQRQPHFWFTHLFLISSLAISYNLAFVNDKELISPHVVLCLIGADMMAAIVGKNFGSLRIKGNKTIEGSVAFALTMIISTSTIISYANPEGMTLTQISCQFVSAVLCSMTELFSGDADNLATLLTYYLVTLIFSCFS